jgi:hypothetical protein
MYLKLSFSLNQRGAAYDTNLRKICFINLTPNFKMKENGFSFLKGKVHKLGDYNVFLPCPSLDMSLLSATPTGKRKICRPKKNGETNIHEDGTCLDGLQAVAVDNDQRFVYNLGTSSSSSSWTCGRAGHCPFGTIRALANGHVIALSNLLRNNYRPWR